MTALSYCGEMVRKHDPDRFLLTMFEPPARRESLFALYAFHHEISKTREVVTETQLGLIRLQWWRDALAGYYTNGTVLKHQVLEPLCAAIRAYDLSRESFDNLIYAREFDLEDRLPATLAGMTAYATYTNAPLFDLTLRVLGQTADEGAVNAAAAAYGLTGLLRATPAHLRQRRCYLPEDLLHRQEISVYDLYDDSAAVRLPPVASAVMAEAHKHLQDLRTMPKSAVPKHLRRAAKLSALYLSQIKRAGGDLFDPALSMPPFLREARLLFC